MRILIYLLLSTVFTFLAGLTKEYFLYAGTVWCFGAFLISLKNDNDEIIGLRIVAQKQEFGARIETLEQERDQLKSALAQCAEALKANHVWHETNDDYGGYAESELSDQNHKAISLPTVQASLKDK